MKLSKSTVVLRCYPYHLVEGRKMMFAKCRKRPYEVIRWTLVQRSSKGFCTGSKKKKNQGPNFKDTLALPKTKFPMRANAWQRESKYVERCTTKLYQWQNTFRNNDTIECFTLHDGPPFANGSLHMGHFMNKTLKDILNRYHLLKGYRVSYIPGWDCHGLPIELKALEKDMPQYFSKESNFDDGLKIRKKARKLAEKTIKNHIRDFQRWGIMADWKPTNVSDGKGIYPTRGYYATMDREYEANQLEVFEKMVNNGLVHRGLKPVYWSPSSRTALAEAELEYVDDHVSLASYVAFPMDLGALIKACGSDLTSFREVSAVIWTTTPWTLLSNVAISVNPDFNYSIVQLGDSSKGYLVASDLIGSFASAVDFSFDDLKIVSEVKGSDLAGIGYQHPLCDPSASDSLKLRNDSYHTVICGSHVTKDSGTGLVHTAPAHGHDDAKVWRENGGKLDQCPCPVDDVGGYALNTETNCMPMASEEIWKTVEGKNVVRSESNENSQSADEVILQHLNERGVLLASKNYTHRYPYDWRTKEPVIVRATKQWFVNLTQLKDDAEAALKNVDLVPANSRSRIESMVEGRDEWCISRQRSWGVPIPAFYRVKDRENGSQEQILLTDSSLRYVRENIARFGTDWWWFVTDDEIEANLGSGWKRGTDTLDVWFDSGSSWKSLLDNTIADVYLEGSDQHRGWFQSSLLTKLGYQMAGTSHVAPYKKLVTHGFVLDEHMRKMSKSLGNVIEPDQLINGEKLANAAEIPKFGVDVLRMWVASSDYTKDTTISVGIVSNVSDSLRKVRNTVRFLLSNLHDFDPEKYNTLLKEPSKLDPIDQHMLNRLCTFAKKIEEYYLNCNFRAAYGEIVRFTSNDVSALYSDCVKDRLYADERDSFTRRSCQMVLWELLQAITITMAPIACFTSEDVFEHAKQEVAPFGSEVDGPLFSVFQCGWYEANPAWENSIFETNFDQLLEIRNHVNNALDKLRKEGTIRSSQEIHVRFVDSDEMSKVMEYSKKHAASLASLLQVEGCSFGPNLSSIDEDVLAATKFEVDSSVVIFELVKSKLHKCERCWKYHAPVDHALCPRCEYVLGH